MNAARNGRSRRALVVAFLTAGTTACPLNLDYLDSVPATDDAGDASDGEPERDTNNTTPPDVAASDAGEPDSANDVEVADRGDDVHDAADATEAGPTNLIRNPGFELGTTPWITFSDGASLALLAASSTYAHSGSFSGHVTNRTQTYQGAVQEIHTLVVPGHTYQSSAWALVAAAADAGLEAGPVPIQPTQLTAAVTCLSDGAQTSNFIPVGVATANSSTWTQVGGTFTVPSCNLVALDIYVEGPAPGIDLYVDDTTVTP